jgi:hypothetical protein
MASANIRLLLCWRTEQQPVVALLPTNWLRELTLYIYIFTSIFIKSFSNRLPFQAWQAPIPALPPPTAGYSRMATFYPLQDVQILPPLYFGSLTGFAGLLSLIKKTGQDTFGCFKITGKSNRICRNGHFLCMTDSFVNAANVCSRYPIY